MRKENNPNFFLAPTSVVFPFYCTELPPAMSHYMCIINAHVLMRINLSQKIYDSCSDWLNRNLQKFMTMYELDSDKESKGRTSMNE